MTLLQAGASRVEISKAVDGMRGVLSHETLHLAPCGEVVFVCCDCGMAHRYAYEFVTNERDEQRLEMRIETDAKLGETVRDVYEFPFKRPFRPGARIFF